MCPRARAAPARRGGRTRRPGDTAFRGRGRGTSKGGGSAHSDLTRAQEAEIKRQNQLEYMAYDVANRLLDAQLEVVAAARRARRKRFRRYDVA